MAQNFVGNCYSSGDGVEKSMERAFKWYLPTAENGNYIAQYNVGNCYYNGEGVEKDYEKAAHFSPWLPIIVTMVPNSASLFVVSIVRE